MKRWLSKTAGWILALVALTVRKTCRIRMIDDPRPDLARRGVPHVFAVLHAHQLAGLAAAEPGSAVMVSRSDDGEIVVPLIRMGGHVPIRGSSGGSKKGGSTALKALAKHVRGGQPAILTVDGPRGPRGHVHKGIGLLAKTTGAVVICAVPIANRRWVVAQSWDRLQIPLPFASVTIGFSEPMQLNPGESLEAFADRVRNCLSELEHQYDPSEAISAAKPASFRRRAA
jgi:lysophospholipid acyltransferase (LPLAT)-like uncharacterized protein